jgi:hypothetical protein
MRTLLILVAATFAMPLSAEEVDPFNPQEANHSVRFETFSMSLADAAELLRGGLDDSKLYETSVTKTAAATAKQESLTVLRSQLGSKALNESLLESIYPTEYESPNTPNSITVTNAGGEKLDVPASAVGQLRDIVTPATPTAFETRNLGISLEVELQAHSDPGVVQLRIAPEWARLVGRSTYGEGVSKLEMPEIESQRLTTGAKVRLDKPFLLGTFNRSPESTVDPTAATRVWFAFVTVSKVEP